MPRCVETWREAHRVLVKLEEADTGSKALVALVSPVFGGADGEKGGRNKRKQAAGDDANVAAVGEPPVRVCFNMRDSNTCDRDNCPYSHDPKALAEARREK